MQSIFWAEFNIYDLILKDLTSSTSSSTGSGSGSGGAGSTLPGNRK